MREFKSLVIDVENKIFELNGQDMCIEDTTYVKIEIDGTEVNFSTDKCMHISEVNNGRTERN